MILNLYKEAFIGQINYLKGNITHGQSPFLRQASSILNEVFLLQLETEKTKFTDKMLLDYLSNRLKKVKRYEKKSFINLIIGDKTKLADQVANDLLNSFYKRFIKGEENA